MMMVVVMRMMIHALPPRLPKTAGHSDITNMIWCATDKIHQCNIKKRARYQ